VYEIEIKIELTNRININKFSELKNMFWTIINFKTNPIDGGNPLSESMFIHRLILIHVLNSLDIIWLIKLILLIFNLIINKVIIDV
jgi:hypothetical protein